VTQVVATGIDDLRELVGAVLGPSEWREITQEQVLAFAELSGDRQWIHVDPDRAEAESPFGGPIAHGGLTLSMIDGFREELVDLGGFELAVAHGWNRVRFPVPVPVGSRVRAAVEVRDVTEGRNGWWEATERWTVEVEGSARPACVAERINRFRCRGEGP
jgi:acyl dehydratase